jgi:arylsulfatase
MIPAALASACGREPPTVHFELEREVDVAEWQSPGGPVAVLAPPLRVHPTRNAPWRFETSVFLRGPMPAGTQAVLHVETPAVTDGLVARALVGRAEVGRFRLEPGYRAYPILLPGGLVGAVLTLAAERPAEAGPDAPFLLHRVSLRASASLPGAPWAPPAAGVLRQHGQSALRFSLILPREARLLFRVAPAPGADAPLRARVSVEPEGGAVHDLWSAEVRPGAAPGNEVALRLHRGEGVPLRVAFHVDGPENSAVDWIAPRLLGTGPSSRFSPTPYTPEEEGRAEALRARLSGLSVLVVVLDAASALHVGAYGYPRMTTPEIDSLARGGVLFERAYTPAPFTVAAISSLWTSQYPEQHHYGERHNAALPRERLRLAEVLAARGVWTAAFVANPSAGPAFGLDRGFSEFHALYRTGAIPRAEGFRPALSSFFERVKGAGPFFAYVHYLEPHFPYDPPHPFDLAFGPDAPLPRSRRRDDAWLRRLNAGVERLGPEERAHLVRLYDGSLAYVDREVGWIRRTLEEHGLLERTVLMVTADHGEAFGERGFMTHGPLLDEASVRVPLVVRFPRGRVPASLRVPGLVDLLDVAPTVADVFGIHRSEGALRSFEGRSLLPLLAGAPAKPAVLSRTMQEHPTFALVHGQWKLILSMKSGASQLFDLAADPAEQTDLSDRFPVRAEAMRQGAARWLRDMHREPAARTEERMSLEDLKLLRALGYVR